MFLKILVWSFIVAPIFLLALILSLRINEGKVYD
jgi:hypothetical protein